MADLAWLQSFPTIARYRRYGHDAHDSFEGYATIVDRRKDMILTAGFNVYPAELERVLCMHPAVALTAVGAIPDEAKGELAKAYVVLRDGATTTEAEMLAHCRQHLAAYKVPRAIQFVRSVPMTASGKIMRRKLSDIDDGAHSVSSGGRDRSHRQDRAAEPILAPSN